MAADVVRFPETTANTLRLIDREIAEINDRIDKIIRRSGLTREEIDRALHRANPHLFEDPRP